jgi:hypothetical protein
MYSEYLLQILVSKTFQPINVKFTVKLNVILETTRKCKKDTRDLPGFPKLTVTNMDAQKLPGIN